MARKRQNNVEGGPSLFDAVEPQAQPARDPDLTKPATAEEWADVRRDIDELRRDAERAGVWIMIPPENLLRRGELYYNQHVDLIVDTMAATGATADVINVVCRDYAGILSGTCRFLATPQQMQNALRALKPYVAFTIDRYGLYFGLLTNYSRFLLRFRDYNVAVKNDNATEQTKRDYINAFYPAMDARAVRWLLSIGYITPSDFAGFDPSEMGQFFDRITDFAALGEYTLYYTVARLALVATPQELAEVVPPITTQTPIAKFCEQVLGETVDNLNKAGEKFAEAFTSATHTEREQARQAGKDWQDDTNTPAVLIHENYGYVLQRPVTVSPHGEQIIDTLPVRRYIERFNAHPEQYTNVAISGNITEMTVQKVFEGVNLLPQYLAATMQLADNGRFVYRTNISEFAEICGYVDANADEKRALLGGLLLLSNLYFVVDRPKKYVEFTNAKGRKVKRMTGGRAALRFLNVPEIGIDSGELLVEIYPESLKGRPTLITPETYKQLRAEAKGLTQSRFNFQIATKSHKSEIALIDDVFGFADMLKYATPEDLPKVKKYIQGHRSRERDRILKWFDDYVKAGIITEFKREPSKANKKDFILTWVCPDPSKLTPPPFNPEADETDDQ